MAQRKLLTNGSAFLRTDGRWAGVVWYMDERGERKRKSFSGTTKSIPFSAARSSATLARRTSTSCSTTG